MLVLQAPVQADSAAGSSSSALLPWLHSPAPRTTLGPMEQARRKLLESRPLGALMLLLRVEEVHVPLKRTLLLQVLLPAVLH